MLNSHLSPFYALGQTPCLALLATAVSSTFQILPSLLPKGIEWATVISCCRFDPEPCMMPVLQRLPALPAKPHASCLLHQQPPIAPQAACTDRPWTAAPTHPSPVRGLRIRTGRGPFAEQQLSGVIQTPLGIPPGRQAQALGPWLAHAKRSTPPASQQASEAFVPSSHLAAMATLYQAGTSCREHSFAQDPSLHDLPPATCQAQQPACSKLPVETMPPSRSVALPLRLLYNSDELSCVVSPRPPVVDTSTSELEWAQAPFLQRISPYDPVHNSQDDRCPPCTSQKSSELMSGHAEGGSAEEPVSFQEAVGQALRLLRGHAGWSAGGKPCSQTDPLYLRYLAFTVKVTVPQQSHANAIRPDSCP